MMAANTGYDLVEGQEHTTNALATQVHVESRVVLMCSNCDKQMFGRTHVSMLTHEAYQEGWRIDEGYQVWCSICVKQQPGQGECDD